MMKISENQQSRPSRSGFRFGFRIPAVTGLTLRFVFVFLLFFTLVRILFYGLYGHLTIDPELSIFVLSFLVGLQFDIVTTATLLIPWILLMHVPLTTDPEIRWRRALTLCLIIFGCIVGLVAVSDCIYYGSAAKRISYEPLLFLQIGDKITEFAFGEYPVLTPFLVAGVLSYWGLVWYWIRRGIGPERQFRWFARVRIICGGMLLIAFSMLGIQGGLRSVSLRIGDA